jgi:hypothetical protein
MTIDNVSRKNGKRASGSRSEHVKARFQTVKQTAAETGRKIADRIPTDTKRGFIDGRQHGKDFVEYGVPYAVGHTVGIAYGASEAIVELAARPVNMLVGLGVGIGVWACRTLSHGSNFENGVEAA